MFVITQRLLLRPPWPEDAPDLQAAIADPEIVQQLAQAPWPYDLDDAETFIRLAAEAADAGTGHALMITRRTDSALIGGAGLVRGADGAWGLGYWLARDAWGKGYASEAAAALLQTAFLGLDAGVVTAEALPDNRASLRLLEWLGFSPVGASSRWMASREAEMPVQALALTRTGWQAHSAGAARKAA